jgi:hypothetical protein
MGQVGWRLWLERKMPICYSREFEHNHGSNVAKFAFQKSNISCYVEKDSDWRNTGG